MKHDALSIIFCRYRHAFYRVYTMSATILFAQRRGFITPAKSLHSEEAMIFNQAQRHHYQQ